MDTNLIVRAIPYLAHCPLVILNDWFIWKVAKRTVGNDAARLSMILITFNRFQTQFIIRCFTNSLEQILTVVAFYYYIDQKDKFTFNTVALTALISLGFMVRNTSPVGWIPLLAIKVMREGSFVPFLLSGIFVALPILFACVWIDTKFYSSDTWVITGYNFLEMNIIYGLSKFFGEDPPWYYLTTASLAIFTILYPLVMYTSSYSHFKAQWAKGKVPYMAYFTIFYVLFFSAIRHKEIRFLIPIIPFAILPVGELLASLIKYRPTLISFFIKLYICVEITVFFI